MTRKAANLILEKLTFFCFDDRFCFGLGSLFVLITVLALAGEDRRMNRHGHKIQVTKQPNRMLEKLTCVSVVTILSVSISAGFFFLITVGTSKLKARPLVQETMKSPRY